MMMLIYLIFLVCANAFELDISSFDKYSLIAESNFHLYTRANKIEPFQIITEDLENLEDSGLSNQNKTLVVIIPGDGDYDSPWVLQMRDNYLRMNDYNVIVFKWKLKGIMDTCNYDCLWMNGQRIGKYFDFLHSNRAVNLDNVHFVGYGLGGHIAGLAGTYLSGKIGRITALDPRINGMSSIKTYGRINSTSAKFVDVIHTCLRNWWQWEAATLLGHANFYPNGGFCEQPGCLNEGHERNSLENQASTVNCAHKRAYKIMNESILNNGSFIATKCSGWQKYSLGYCQNETTTYAGEYAKSDSRGMFFFRTNKKSPLALESSDSEVYFVNVNFDELNEI